MQKQRNGKGPEKETALCCNYCNKRNNDESTCGRKTTATNGTIQKGAQALKMHYIREISMADKAILARQAAHNANVFPIDIGGKHVGLSVIQLIHLIDGNLLQRDIEHVQKLRRKLLDMRYAELDVKQGEEHESQQQHQEPIQKLKELIQSSGNESMICTIISALQNQTSLDKIRSQ